MIILPCSWINEAEVAKPSRQRADRVILTPQVLNGAIAHVNAVLAARPPTGDKPLDSFLLDDLGSLGAPHWLSRLVHAAPGPVPCRGFSWLRAAHQALRMHRSPKKSSKNSLYSFRTALAYPRALP